MVEDYFPDWRLFLDMVQSIMRSDGDYVFTFQEIYRLKKLKLGLHGFEDGFETSYPHCASCPDTILVFCLYKVALLKNIYLWVGILTAQKMMGGTRTIERPMLHLSGRYFAHSLSDTLQILHLNVQQYPWAHAHDNFVSVARLDRIYCFEHQLSFIKGVRFYQLFFSDHSLVSCTNFVAILNLRVPFGLRCMIEVFLTFWTAFRLA